MITSFCRRLRWTICACLYIGLPVTYVYADAVPGGVYVFNLPEGVTAATYDDRPVLVRDGVAYVGIGIKTVPGTKQLTLQGATPATHSFEVVAKQYPEQHLTIKNRKMVNPDPKDLERIRGESAKMRAEYRRFTNAPAPQRFDKPLEGIMTSPFGHRRVLNGEPRNPHSGLDIAGDTGTPVHAAAAGTVRITGDFYFNGNTVIIDHGQGLVTMYCHLSEIVAEQDTYIEAGDVLGLVGATGRVTGPHLHWSVSLNGYRVDPLQVIDALNPSP